MDSFTYLFLPGDALFVNYNYNPHNPIYKASAIPGKKEGVSGSIIIGHNLGINKYIDEDKKKAAAEFLKFVASKEIQKKFIIKDGFVGGLTSLYDDEEVCRMINCEIIKDAYPFSFMSNDLQHFADDTYHLKYRENLFKYIYEDKPLSEVLKKIEDVTKVYTFQVKTDDSTIGLVIFISFFVFLTFMILSIIFVFIKKFEKRFDFLTKDMWMVTVLGSVVLMCSILTLYDSIENYKCQLRVALINVGFVLSISPSLHRLITNFPSNNKISEWVDKNKHIFILIIMIFTASLNGILAISTYDSKNITMPDERHYEKCIMNNKIGLIVYNIIRIYDFFLIVMSLCLIFLEWNLEVTKMDVKYLATALFMDTLSLVLIIIMESINFKGYLIYNSLLAVSIMLLAVFNHIFVYFIRILPVFGNNTNHEDSRKILGKVSNSGVTDSRKATSFNQTTSKDHTATVSTTSSNDSMVIGITRKIMNYHNQTVTSTNSNSSAH